MKLPQAVQSIRATIAISTSTPPQISGLPRSRWKNIERVALRHGKTLMICRTTIALRQPVVACRYRGSRMLDTEAQCSERVSPYVNGQNLNRPSSRATN